MVYAFSHLNEYNLIWMDEYNHFPGLDAGTGPAYGGAPLARDFCIE